MNLVKGALWDELGKADLILFTANSMLKQTPKGPELVMGKGAAKEAKDRFPRLPLFLGQMIFTYGLQGMSYGVMVPAWHPTWGTFVGAFQTKYDWRDKSDLDLIRFSCHCLTDMLPPYARIALPFPGVGNGGRKREDVLPLLEGLPDHVWVYER